MMLRAPVDFSLVSYVGQINQKLVITDEQPLIGVCTDGDLEISWRKHLLKNLTFLRMKYIHHSSCFVSGISSEVTIVP